MAADVLGVGTIALPAIGTGMLDYPPRTAARIAIEEVRSFLETYDETRRCPLEKIIFCVFTGEVNLIYKSLLP